MKWIVYQRKIPAESTTLPNGETIVIREAYLQVEKLGFTDSNKEIQIAEALKYSYNGEYTIEEEPDDRPLDEIRTEKLAELSSSCNDAITAGMDVETTQGTEHFSLQETDQINLTTALSAVQSGAAGYPYHADGQLCRLFTAAEIQAIAAASVKHKLYHTTLCNHLLTWARRAETREELSGITYAADGMPDDLSSNMAAVLAAAAGDNNA